ncbi:lytic transglycosylase domain-containing protein [Bradyrhizobium australiense]|uniref:Lytic transglycosylase domain-containing protein n=1 Tax=Bradyrhizobium australiense TaxID=2721161 RepID=A0A7Y4GQV9_9BRAD|nr:lytic transglycosylase domain-containing protein [Bradyrhizobium australiense]NOJ40221.1 lytic transglycosylase domain-containing protein [Bradyrhizobium australiense]
MRYLFAAVIAVFVVAVDVESSDIRTELSFVVAEAQSEPATTSNSHRGTVTASVEYSQESDATSIAAASYETAADADAHAAASFNNEAASPNPICEAVKTAAEENDIPIGFLARLLWQESRFRTAEVSSAGAQGIAQFMPQTAVEMGLRDPFDPLQAIPASARFLRKLHDQFGNIGLAAAAYNAGGGRIEKWLSRRGALPKETRAYVKIITGHKAEAWTAANNTVHMPTDLPDKAPCEGVGGLSKDDQIAEMPVNLAPSVSAMLQKADIAEESHAAPNKRRLVASRTAATVRAAFRNANAKATRLAGKAPTRKLGKQSVTRLASASGAAGRTKSSRASREL